MLAYSYLLGYICINLITKRYNNENQCKCKGKDATSL